VTYFLLHEVLLAALYVESMCGLLIQAATLEVVDGGIACFANISDAVGDCDRRQAGATTEGTALEK